MNALAGYEIEELQLGDDFELLRARDPVSGASVLLKVSTALPASPALLGRLEHELALAQHLDEAWAVRPLTLTHHQGRTALILTDAGGLPLDALLARRTLELTGALQIAIGLAVALRRMHEARLVHRDVKPSNVFVDAAGAVHVTGFGIASRFLRERQSPVAPEAISGTFAYMAPEQTGRMNRSVDARTDLYSVGVTLYEMLTGSLPFQASDALEWIHCHMARAPQPPGQRVAGLPEPVTAVVLKLLAKDPEDRYQTAAGVEADLRECLAQWQRHGYVRPLALATNDTSDRLVMPEKLYGRDAEIAILLRAFERVVSQGTTQLVLVRGYAGIGKSSIISELHQALVPQRGLFAAGKFDQYKRHIPYATLAQAFQALVRQLLHKSNEELGPWRDELIRALDVNGQLMVNLVPELGLIIGEQAPIPGVEPQEAGARFHRVFRQLVGVFARPEHPLVLFLDDLQWLDGGTLELLERLVSDREPLSLLLIGAYRDNEVGPTHPLSTTLASIRHAGGAVSEIRLDALQVGHLAQLCADALHTDVEHVTSLADLVFEKTAGNPFFAIQFVSALAEEGLLGFDSRSSTWRWDMARIRGKGITDNVAELMAGKLGRLAAVTREALGQLACLGNFADIGVFAALRGSSEEQAQATLRDAVEAGLILATNRTFAFSHDRVQEAAYALIPNHERAPAHLRIGRALMAITPAAALEEKIFEIVNQFERGASAIDSAAERERVAELYFAAGKRARTASASASALAYFRAGRRLLGEDSWGHRYRLTLDFETYLAECEIVGGELALAEDRLGLLSQHAAGSSDQAQVVCLSVLLYFTTGRSERAVEVALGFLSRTGRKWSARPSEADVREEYLQMHRTLSQCPMDTLIDLPTMSDPECIATMAVLTELFPAAYAVDRYLLELVLLRMTNLSLEYGNCESSSVAYSALNMALGSHFADYKTAFGLGQLACELVGRRGADRYKARVYSCFAAFTMPWIKHLPECLPLMTQAFQIGSSMGDMAFAAYNSRNSITHLLVAGVPLSEVQREAEQAMAFARKIQLGLPAEKFIEQLEVVRRLRGVFGPPAPNDDEWAMNEVEGDPRLAMMACYHWVFRLLERFVAADFTAALQAAAHVEPIRWAMRSSIEEAEYDFYAALAHAAVAETSSTEEREQHLQALSKHHARIAIWAENCPENFDNRRALIAAEISRLQGKEMAAQQRYEEAVRLSRRHGFVQNEALANELAGKFYAARGLETAADAHLLKARDCYERWGALGKVRQIDARYPHLRREGLGSVTATIDTSVAQLDVEAVDKASQTLSSEMVLPSLLEKLIHLAVEHAGAGRGLLILLYEDEPYIEAEATTSERGVEVALRKIRVAPSDLPRSALQYVLRTHERLVLDDASAQNFDPDDAYLRHHRSRSVLCLPIFKQAKVVGALYLENDLTTGAFTPDRVAVLEFLASQAAIWLENARLYSDLRRSEAWLKEAQHLSSTGSFYWQVDSEIVEFSEQMLRIYELDPKLPVTLRAISTRIHPDDLNIVQEMIDTARGPASDLDCLYRARMPDLSVKHLHLVAHGVRNKDGRLEYIGAIQDVTQRRLSEEALSNVRSELAHVARVTSLGVLTASIAHDLNQPLTAVVTFAESCLRWLSKEPPDLDRARRAVQRIIETGHQASDLVRTIRTMLRKSAPEFSHLDLNEVILSVVDLLRGELRSKAVSLEINLSEALPPVHGDRVQLQQVIVNLVKNGVEAMIDQAPEGRLLRLVTGRAPDGSVHAAVEDSGSGLDAAQANRIFEPFFTTKRDGMGLGLAICQTIIETHRGRLWMSPRVPRGCAFQFELPSAKSQ